MATVEKTEAGKPDRLVAVNLRQVPSRLRKAFKLLCVQEEVTIESALLAYMEFSVENNGLITQTKT